jgi:ABC-2 type transport system permease protein
MMSEALALIRKSWLSAISYRLNMLISLGGLLVSIVPLYFIANAIQPVIEDAIRAEGGEYFAFLLVGIVTFSFLTVAVSALPGAIGGGIGSGTLEAIFATPARLPALLVGFMGYGFIWTAIRAIVLLLAGLAFGAHYSIGSLLPALLILVLIVLAYVPVGLVAAAMVLVFRTTGPLPQAVLVLSGLLGGVYYPTHVIPSWLQHLSNAVPLTYGLRPLRQTLLEGMPLQAVIVDIWILCAFVIGLLTLGWLAFASALRYSRRAGTLSQY